MPPSLTTQIKDSVLYFNKNHQAHFSSYVGPQSSFSEPPSLCCLLSAGKSIWELIVEQFEDLLVRILLLAACISFVS